MDPLTHGVVGAVIRKTYTGKRKRVMEALVLSAVIPDIDYLSMLVSTESFITYHRGITHSFIALPVISALLAVVFAWGEGRRGSLKKYFNEYWVLCSVGVFTHLLLDLMMPAGIFALDPIDPRKYSIGAMSVLDPFLLVVSLGAMLLFRKKKHARKAAVWAMVICCLYIGGRVVLKHQALSYSRGVMDEYIVKDTYPLPFSIAQWWYVASSGDGSKRVGIVDLYTRRVFESESYGPDATGELVQRALDTKMAKNFLRMFPDSHIGTGRDKVGRFVRIRALSYAHSRRPRFIVMVHFNGAGEVIRTEAFL